MENTQTITKKNSFGKKVVSIFKAITNGLKYFYKEVICYPLHILTHPVEGWQSFKQEKKGKMNVALIIMLLYVIMRMVEYKYLGPIVNGNNPYEFNSITILIYGIMPPILLSVANWSITTLMDGKGKLKEIFMMGCYVHLPLVLVGFFNIIVSNFITEDEAQFILLLDIVSLALTGFMILTGLISIHEYGLGKVLWSIILTILATAIIAFLALLIFNLAQQIYGFVYSIYNEVVTRFM